MSSNTTDIADLKTSVTFVQETHDAIKSQINKKTWIQPKDHPDDRRQLIDDIQNRSRRNDIVIQGVPEGSEAQSRSCENFVHELLTSHLKLEGADEIVIDRAHRTGPPPGAGQAVTLSSPRPRPIHCRLLRHNDRQYILKNAAKHLKNNKFKSKNVFISDDVTPKVRAQRKDKEMREMHLRRIQGEERVHFAYIPWSVPAMIRYKIRDDPFRCYRLEGDAWVDVASYISI